MAFTDLENEELVAVAQFFSVDLPAELPKTKAAQKKVLVAALESGDEPVTWDDYETVYLPQKPKTPEDLAAEKLAAEKVEAEKVRDTLVKMQGRASFVLGGSQVRFTHDHPFAVVTKEEAVYLTSNYEGFSYATPQEAADYYA